MTITELLERANITEEQFRMLVEINHNDVISTVEWLNHYVEIH